MKIIERNRYIEKLRHRMGNGMAKILAGPKGSGKTFLLFKLFRDFLLESGVKEEDIVTVDLEGRDANLRDPRELYRHLKDRLKDFSFPRYVFIDEAQFCVSKDEEWRDDEPYELYNVLNALVNVRSRMDVYVTTSRVGPLCGKVKADFRGRGDEIRVRPLTFSESCLAFGEDDLKAVRQYCLYGGMPAVAACESDGEREEYLSGAFGTFEAVRLREIKSRRGAREGEAREVAAALAEDVGTFTDPQRLSDRLLGRGERLSYPTLASYVSNFEDVFYVDKVSRFEIKRERPLRSPSKYYFADVGLRNALTGFDRRHMATAEENVVYCELVSRGYAVRCGVVYEQTFDGPHERRSRAVDFVLDRGYIRYYVQYVPDPESEEAQEKERTLLRIKDAFKKIMILSWDVPKHRDPDGIMVIGFRDFLCDPVSLETE